MVENSPQIRTMIISGDKSRRDKLEKSLINKPEISFIVIPSVDATNLIDSDEIYYRRAFEYINKRSAVTGEIGCYLAHQECYKRIIANKWEWCLILEDNDRVDELNYKLLISQLQAVMRDKYLKDLPTILHLVPNQGPIYVADRDHIQGVFHCLSIPRRTKAYFINQSAAALAIKEGLPIKDVADWPHWIREVNILISEENFFTVDQSMHSLIGKREARITPNGVNQKIINFLKFFCGIEYLNYYRNTRINNYFERVVLDRIIRRLPNRPNPKNPNILTTFGFMSSVLSFYFRKKIRSS